MKNLTLLLAFLFTFSVYSQNDSAYVFGLPEMMIKQKVKGREVTYLFENTLNKFTLTSTILFPDTNQYKYKVNLTDISAVSLRNGSKFWQGAAAGGGIGFFLGFLFGGFIDIHNSPTFHVDQGFVLGIVSAIPFALIGGLIGALLPDFDEYSVTNMPINQKYQFLKRTFGSYHQKR